MFPIMMKLSLVEDQAIQAQIADIAGAETFDRLFAGIRFDEIDGNLLFAIARRRRLRGRDRGRVLASARRGRDAHPRAERGRGRGAAEGPAISFLPGSLLPVQAACLRALHLCFSTQL